MKEVNQLKKEILLTPGWTKWKSVEIAVFSAESCIGNYNELYKGNEQVHNAFDGARVWLHTEIEQHIKAEVKKTRETERNAAGGLGAGGEAGYFAIRSARFAIEAAKKKSEKKAAKYAAKAIYAAALSKGWENPRHEGGVVGQYFMVDEAYDQEVARIRQQIKSL
jgi:hypothetical protein